MLAVARRLSEADDFVRSGSWTAWKLDDPELTLPSRPVALGLEPQRRAAR
jgi:hypothetical protein